ncbi:MAG: hypothetical protein PHU71_02690 [Candidatus Gracilibacteria bacterium]|nr:hypothetical protein [Candidatus Gracilibacteria bacterium]
MKEAMKGHIGESAETNNDQMTEEEKKRIEELVETAHKALEEGKRRLRENKRIKMYRVIGPPIVY